jgi:hypothetical protein
MYKARAAGKCRPFYYAGNGLFLNLGNDEPSIIQIFVSQPNEGDCAISWLSLAKTVKKLSLLLDTT